jgi:hypothetical protein
MKVDPGSKMFLTLIKISRYTPDKDEVTFVVNFIHTQFCDLNFWDPSDVAATQYQASFSQSQIESSMKVKVSLSPFPWSYGT